MNVNSRRNLFYQRPDNSVYRMFFYLLVILGLVWVVLQVDRGVIKPPFQPQPTPTRSAVSYAQEGDAHFEAGELDAAITAYGEAVRVDPNDAQVWAKLARIQTYTSTLLTTDAQKNARLAEALESINKAVEIAPEDSTVHAIRALVLDWNATPLLYSLDPEQQRLGQEMLNEAEQEAQTAIHFDNQNTLALAFYAEILVDQQNWSQAEQYIQQALERDSSLMDVHRVYAYVLESLGAYNQAIQEYDNAISISPNLTFLHLRAGANYRRLAFASTDKATQNELYDKSLEYFDRAAKLNEQLGIADPIPYLSIAKTYSQKGDFFIAARNVQKALELDPSNADTMGQLGIIYFKARNYEGSIPVLSCVINGCTAEENCQARFGRDCDPDFNETGAPIEPLELTPNTVVYYYTYGSVLAALSRPQQNYCPEALSVLRQVKAAYPADVDIQAIVAAGEQICASLAEN